MAERGKRDLPRPPRRVPSWATQDDVPRPRTVLQPRAAGPDPAAPPPLPPRLRLRFLIPLIVFVLVLGVGAGWLVRQDSLSLDTADVEEAVGPAVVRVLATTCGGTGRAAGVLLPDGVVLTAAAGIREPVSVAVLTADGRVRRANVLGSGADGVAVLRITGRLDNRAAVVAPEPPDPAADRAIAGYTLDDDPFVRQAGTASEPRELADVVPQTWLGASLFDKQGRLIGLVAGETVADSSIVGPEALARYAAADPPITPEPAGTCLARGPQDSVEPDLAVADTPLAGEVRQVLGEYLDTLNRHDFAAMQDTYSRRLARGTSAAADTRKHGTSYAFGAVITEVSAAGFDVANARMKFTVLFSPNNAGAGGRTCSRLDLRYRLVREEGRLRIDNAAGLASDPSCDTD